MGYGATFVYGLLFANTDVQANVLALNEADNWLHLISALAGLAIALWPARDHGARTGASAGSGAGHRRGR